MDWLIEETMLTEGIPENENLKKVVNMVKKS